MADSKISEFASALTLNNVDIFPIIQSGNNKKATLGQISSFISSSPKTSNSIGPGAVDEFEITLNVSSNYQIVYLTGAGYFGFVSNSPFEGQEITIIANDAILQSHVFFSISLNGTVGSTIRFLVGMATITLLYSTSLNTWITKSINNCLILNDYN